jgi:hypothetical protein
MCVVPQMRGAPRQNVHHTITYSMENLESLYENKSQTSRFEAVLKPFLSATSFNLIGDDELGAFYHASATREAADALLLSAADGAFLIRPSSKSNQLALTWKEAGVVKHNLIRCCFPGFVMRAESASVGAQASTSESSRQFRTLAHLVANSPFLRAPIECTETAATVAREASVRSCSAIVGSAHRLLNGRDSEDENALRVLCWSFSATDNVAAPAQTIQRTVVRYRWVMVD